MPLLLWRLLTLLLAALSMALSFCHLMEMPVRLTWAPALWMATTNFGGLYYLFGNVGAVIDVSVIVAAAILCALTRRRHPSFHLTILGARLMATGLGAWFAFVAPMARRMGSSLLAAGEAGRRRRATEVRGRTTEAESGERRAGRTRRYAAAIPARK